MSERHDAFLVTQSDIPGIEVGAVLLDTGGDETGREWTSIHFESEETREARGRWLLRVCASCRTLLGVATPHDHEGKCGNDEARAQALTAINAAVDR